jgi:predicted cation transporter
MYICVWGNGAHMSTILPLDIAAFLMAWYILLFMLSIKSRMVEDLLKAYYTLFNMLRWYSTTLSIKVSSIDAYFLFGSYLYSNIKSHQWNQIRLSVINIVIILLTFYDLQYMYIYSVCCVRTIYAKYTNFRTN